MLRTFVRTTGQTVTLSERDAAIMRLPGKLEAEAPNEDRAQISALTEEIVQSRGVMPFGIGYYGTAKLYEERFNTEAGGGYGEHNTFIAWFLELGIFGFAAAMALLIRFFWLSWALIRKGPRDERPYFKALTLAMLGFLLHGLFHPAYIGPMMFVLLGLMFGGAARVMQSRYDRGN
jgi:hypothetical protein